MSLKNKSRSPNQFSSSTDPLSMASYQRLLRFCITIFFCFLSLSSSQRVTLTLYYEALCPYCADFIVNHLVKIFEFGLISDIDLKLVPWGNTVIKPDGSIHCQHGQDECALNAIQAVGSAYFALQMQHFRYIYCTERLVLENKLENWADCLENAGLLECYMNGYGNQVKSGSRMQCLWKQRDASTVQDPQRYGGGDSEQVRWFSGEAKQCSRSLLSKSLNP